MERVRFAALKVVVGMAIADGLPLKSVRARATAGCKKVL
jgi:hypothetical protein